MKWHVNCRGIDEHGIPLVAVDGSQSIKAVDRRYLIAAAPDLLEALQNIAINLKPDSKARDYFGDKVVDDAIKRAEAAIAKAEGRE